MADQESGSLPLGGGNKNKQPPGGPPAPVAAKPSAPAETGWFEVTKGGKLPVKGGVTNVPVGKQINSASFDVKKLRQAGIELKPIEPPSWYQNLQGTAAVLLMVLALAVGVAGCGDGAESSSPTGESVESVSSPFTVTGTFRGSYQCGADWWHVDQAISMSTIPLTVAFPAGTFPTLDAGSNAVTFMCWTSPVPLAWGGVSYYSTKNMSVSPDGSPYNCVMYSHRANKPWSYAAYVWLPAGSLQLYPGSPTTWLLDVWDASASGTHDGIGAACGGHFYLSLQ